MLVPKLRFKEFKDEWNFLFLKEITNLIKDGTHGTHEDVNDGIPLLSAKDIYNDKINIPLDCRKISINDYNSIYKNYTLEKNDILFTIVGTIGRSAIYNNEKIAFQRSVAVLRTNINNNSMFIRNLLNTPRLIGQINNLVNTSAQGGIYLSALSKLKCIIPTYEEQEKIACFLSLLDKKIDLQKQKIETLKEYKKGLIQHIYNKNYYNIVKMKDIIKQKSIRNTNNDIKKVYSVSNKNGFILQSEQFKEREVASEDISNYKIVKKDYFAYNPARINVGSIARLKDDELGIISPMYICFICNDIILPEYLESFFESQKFIYEMNRRLEGSVRMCLSYEAMINIPIDLPDIEEQSKLVLVLNKINEKLRSEEEKYRYQSELKKGLLQKMFI